MRWCVQGGLDCEYSCHIIFFTWQGFHELDEVNGVGSAEFDKDGVIEIEIRFYLGDEAILKALLLNRMRHLVMAAARQARSLAPGARPTRWNQLR